MMLRVWIVLWALAGAAGAVDPQIAGPLQQLLADEARVPHVGKPTAMPVRDFGQTTWALLLAGQPQVARDLVEVGLVAVGKARDTGRPTGALPPTLRADGSTADPRYLVDAQAVAALLEAATRYAIAIPDAERGPWLQQWWPQIAEAGEFLVGWTRGPRGAPYPAYDPRVGRDVGGTREAIGTLLGVTCAQRLAELAGKAVPETWAQRREALETLVRTTDFSDTVHSYLPWGARQARGLFPEDHPIWSAQTGPEEGRATLRALSEMAPEPGDHSQVLILHFRQAQK